MISPPPAPAHPQAINRVVLGTSLAALLLPALHWSQTRKQNEPLVEQRRQIEATLAPGARTARAIPPDWKENVSDDRWSWASDLRPATVELESLFPEATVRAFQDRQGTRHAFEGLVHAPTGLGGAASRERINLEWEAAAGIQRLLAAADGDPLLAVRYRIYRWRDGEEPRLLASCEPTQTSYEDLDLPIGRDELLYSVATVLEGTYGELPTLLESAESEVFSIYTLENFKVEVLDGSADEAQVQIDAWIDGDWTSATFTVREGEVLGGLRDVRGVEVDFGTGWTVLEIDEQVESVEEMVRRPEFLPDGRRKLDPDGQPSFVESRRTLPTRTVELSCRNARFETRAFRSLPLRAD